MHGIREDMGRGQVPFKSPQGSKLKRDLLFHDNIRYAKNIIKSLEFKGSMLFHSNFPYVGSTLFDNSMFD